MQAVREETEYGSALENTDAVSLNDTDESEAADEYVVDCVLDESDIDVEQEDGSIKPMKHYLIKWNGYSNYRSTWEPPSNLSENAHDTLHEWQEEKMRRDRGFKERFDREAFEAWRRKITARRVRLHEKRNKKRARLGKALVDYAGDESTDEDVYSGQTSAPSYRSSGVIRNSLFRNHVKRLAVESPGSSDSDTPLIKKRKPSNSSGTTAATGSSLQAIERPDNALKLHSAGQARPIPMARMVAGPSRKGGPSSKVRPTSMFRNVFDAANTATRRNPSAGTEQEPRKFRNLSHQNNVRKKSMRESAPRIETLNLKDPQTGESISSRIIPTELASTNNAHSPGHMYLSAHSDSARSAVETPKETITDVQNIGQQSLPLICWFWETNRFCRFGETCGLAHDDNGIPAVYKNKSQTLITCPHWLANFNCNKPPGHCIYAHARTNYVASTSSQLPIRRLDNHCRPDNLKGPYRPDSLYRDRSCYYWFFRGECSKSNETCKFAHEIREYVAAPRNEGPLRTSDYPEECAARGLPERSERRGSAHDINGGVSADREKRELSDSPPPRARMPSEELASQNQVFSLPYTTSIETSPVESKSYSRDERPSVVVQTKFCTEKTSEFPSLEVLVELSGMDAETLQKFNTAAGPQPYLEFTHLFCALTLQNYIDTSKYPKYASGYILPPPAESSGSVNLASEQVKTNLGLNNLAENLKAHVGGAVCFHANFTMIIFPTGQADWKFLGCTKPGGTEAKLQFYILAPITSYSPIGYSSLTPSKTPTESPLDVDVRRLIDHFEKPVDKNIFLIFSPRCEAMFRSLMSSLRQSGFKVYHAAVLGSWDYFCSNYTSGVVLFESRFNQFHKVLGLHDRIIRNRFNVFRLSDDINSMEIQPLFQNGQAVYFADSTFMEEPKATLNVLMSLNDRIKRYKQRTQILGRPALLDWLLEIIAAENNSESRYSSPQWKKSYYLLSSLLDGFITSMPRKELDRLRKLGRSPRTAPPANSPLFYPQAGNLPAFESLWQSTSVTEDRTIISKSDDLMIDWFAGWALSRADTYRRFVFLTRASEQARERWRAKYTHLNITSAEKYAEKYAEKPPSRPPTPSTRQRTTEGTSATR